MSRQHPGRRPGATRSGRHSLALLAVPDMEGVQGQQEDGQARGPRRSRSRRTRPKAEWSAMPATAAGKRSIRSESCSAPGARSPPCTVVPGWSRGSAREASARMPGRIICQVRISSTQRDWPVELDRRAAPPPAVITPAGSASQGPSRPVPCSRPASAGGTRRRSDAPGRPCAFSGPSSRLSSGPAAGRLVNSFSSTSMEPTGTLVLIRTGTRCSSSVMYRVILPSCLNSPSPTMTGSTTKQSQVPASTFDRSRPWTMTSQVVGLAGAVGRRYVDCRPTSRSRFRT